MNTHKKLQVFVSSTYRDLRAERQAAVEAILKAGHIPAGMELFSSGNESQLETIRRWIDDSDIYMLILGARYGSVDPKTSLSYTELEYDYALSTSKPIFAVVITEAAIDAKVKSEGLDAIETEYSKELKFFREKVLSKISSFFTDTKDIKLAVHETMADYVKRLDFTGWVSGKEIVDTAPLLDELSRLRQENEKLQSELSKVKIAPPRPASKPSSNWPDDEMREIGKIIQDIEVSTKAFATDKTKPATKHSVLQIFSALRDRLITGVSNRHDASDSEAFLYFNVCPKLKIYDLAALEKVSGVQWQRYRLTPKGKALLAFLDKQKSKTSEKAVTQVEQREAKEVTTSTSDAKPRRKRTAKPSSNAA